MALNTGPFGPADGYAYSKIELGAIWALEAHTSDILNGRALAAEQHMQMSKRINFEVMGLNDQAAIKMLERATEIDLDNLGPIGDGDASTPLNWAYANESGPPEWPCSTDHTCEDIDDWIHGNPEEYDDGA